METNARAENPPVRLHEEKSESSQGIASAEVWQRLTPSQQQRTVQTLACLCYQISQGIPRATEAADEST